MRIIDDHDTYKNIYYRGIQYINIHEAEHVLALTQTGLAGLTAADLKLFGKN